MTAQWTEFRGSLQQNAGQSQPQSAEQTPTFFCKVNFSCFLLQDPNFSCLCLKETQLSMNRTKENCSMAKTKLNQNEKPTHLELSLETVKGPQWKGKIRKDAPLSGDHPALSSHPLFLTLSVSATPATQCLAHTVPSLLPIQQVLLTLQRADHAREALPGIPTQVQLLFDKRSEKCAPPLRAFTSELIQMDP